MQPIVTDGVAWSVCHDREPCENGWTDRDVVWGMDSGGPPGPKEACVRWECTLVNTTELSMCDGDADFLSYYSDHLFWFFLHHRPFHRYTHTGWPQSRRKNFLCFPGFSRAIIILFQRLSQQSTRNNDFHVSRVIPHQLLVMWLTRACCPILLKSTVIVHQRHLAAYGLLDTSCTQNAKSVYTEVAQNYKVWI